MAQPPVIRSSIVPNDADEMTTDFQVNGVMYYADPQGSHLKHENVVTQTGMCRAYFEEEGFDADFVERFIY